MKKPSPSSGGMRTWQEIGQSFGGRPLSAVAWRKRWVKGIGVFAAMVLTAGLVALGAWSVKTLREDPARAGAVADSPLKSVEFRTDGVLTEDWVKHDLSLVMGAPLAGYDVFALRRKLLENGQISAASVERVLPGTLKITLSERKPMLRVAADDGAGGYTTLMLSRDGTVYSGKLYPDDMVNKLPWLAGVGLRRDTGGGYAKVAGAGDIAALLSEAGATVPQLASQWTVIDLSAYDPRPQAPLSEIKVRSSVMGELVFLAGNYRQQVERLALTARVLQEKQAPSRHVDLSLDNQVVVQLVSMPAPPAKTKNTAKH